MYRFKTSDGKTFKTLDSRDYFSNYSVNTIVTVSERSIIRAVHQDIIGLGVESGWLGNLLNLYNQYPKISQLLRNLGGCVLRIGGTTQDYADWQPDGTASYGYEHDSYYSVYTSQTIDNVSTIVTQANWKLLWGLNFGEYNPSKYAGMANYIYTKLGSKLLAIAIGNEPEAYHGKLRAADYSYTTYKTEFESYVSAIKGCYFGIPLVGPDSNIWDPWLQGIVHDENINVIGLTQHYYPASSTGSGSTAPTIDNLLSTEMIAKIKNNMSGMVDATSSAGIPLIIGESNSIAGGGKPGVSNSFANTIWGIDYLFTALELGAKTLVLQGAFSSAIYAPINVNGDPAALYYSMLLFHYAAPSGNAVYTNTLSTSNVVSHAVVDSNSVLRVVIINKELNRQAFSQIITNSVYSKAFVIFLTAPSITSTLDFKFGGSSVDTDGTWTPKPSQVLTVTEKSTVVTVPSSTVAVVTFTP